MARAFAMGTELLVIARALPQHKIYGRIRWTRSAFTRRLALLRRIHAIDSCATGQPALHLARRAVEYPSFRELVTGLPYILRIAPAPALPNQNSPHTVWPSCGKLFAGYEGMNCFAGGCRNKIPAENHSAPAFLGGFR